MASYQNTDNLTKFNKAVSGEWYNNLDYYNDLPDEWKSLIKANPYAHSYNPTGFQELFQSGKINNAALELQQSFDAYNADVYSRYLQYVNSLPETQVAQNRVAGLNTDLLGGVDASSISQGQQITGSSTLSQIDPAEGFSKSLGAIGSAISTMFGGVGTIAGAFNSIANARKALVDAGLAPEYYRLERDKFGLDKYKVGAEVRNINEDIANKQLDRTIRRNAEERAAFTFGAEAREKGYINPSVKGSSSAVSAGYKAADKSGKYHDIIRRGDIVDAAKKPGFDVFFDTSFNPQPYMLDYIKLQRDFLSFKARSQFIEQRAKNSLDVFNTKYYNALNPDLMATAANEENKYNASYYNQLDPSMAAQMENAKNEFDTMLNKMRYAYSKRLSDTLNTWMNRAEVGDIYATQVLGAYYGLNIPGPSAPWNYAGAYVPNAVADGTQLLKSGVDAVSSKVSQMIDNTANSTID